MATKKEYAYYKKGNKFAIIQKNITSANNAITDDTYGRYKSPVASVTDGIQLEYVYSRDYLLPNPLTVDTNKFHINGWTIVDGYLTFLKTAVEGEWSDGWATSAEVAVNEFIVVGGSSRWNGKHKVQEVQDSSGSHGGIKTYTKVNDLELKYFTDNSVTWVDDETITGVHSSVAGLFSTTDIVWISGSDATEDNNGLFTGISFSGTTMTFANATKYLYSEREQTTESEVLADTDGFEFESDNNNVIYIRQAFRDSTAYVISDIDSLNDEDDTIDLSPYLSKALVYYIKGRLMEDQLNLEGKEYFMREFRRMVEKHSSATSLTGGTYRIQGHGMTK